MSAPAAKDPTAMKKAVAYMLRGGSLTSEQCEACGGPLVKFEGKLVCINCGRQQGDGAAQEGAKSVPADNSPPPVAVQTEGFEKAASIFEDAMKSIEHKVHELAAEARDERDSMLLREKGELIRLYLEVLGKMRDLARR